MVKLQRVSAYKYKTKSGQTKEHYKYVINIPQDVIEELGWSDGEELKLLITRGTLSIKASTD